jgi:dihydrolipoamide dehydrogenase
MAHAVFGSPQIASLGDTESDLEEQDYGTGTFHYDETALWSALDTKGGSRKCSSARTTRCSAVT